MKKLKIGAKERFLIPSMFPPMNKGTLNSLKITEPSPEHSSEQGTFGGSLN